MAPSVHVVYNAAAGDGLAPRLLATMVRPILSAWAVQHPSASLQYHETKAALGALGIGIHLALLQVSLTLVVLGGDGTVHELLEGVLQHATPPHVNLVIVPAGTANALYHATWGPETTSDNRWRLRSLESFLQPSAESDAPHPLTLLSAKPAGHVAAVVVSHALHAAILRDSEALRLSHPGTERFKMAAEANATCWYTSTLCLYGVDGGPVLRYETSKRAFEPVHCVDEDYECCNDGSIRINGPFSYANAMMIDRLEATFVPAPFAGCHCDPTLRRPHGAIDMVLLRPERRPGTLHKMQHGRSLHALHADFARDILHPVLFQGMYQGGTHVDFVYGEDGSCQTSGAGRPVVEYFRVSGYEWIAAPDDAQAYSTCIDGTVVEQHRTVCSVIPAEVYLW